MADRDYVLGAHDEEIKRLGLQHRVWRARALDSWRRAGFTVGGRILDFGAGPGYAAIDLAEIVGPTGEIVAAERSRRFLDTLSARAQARGLSWITPLERDLATDTLGAHNLDGAWARWIFAFLPDPRAALAKLVAAVRPGGAVVIHEYIDYSSWRLSPRSAPFERFVAEVMASWRAAGGEPDIGLDAPRWLEEMGLTIERAEPMVDMIGPRDFTWNWPQSFVATNVERLVGLGRLSREDGDAARADYERASVTPGARTITPIVLDLVARKPA